MTTEEKAKAYDEALEAARKELKQDLHESGVWAIQRIFPQLRESEDERIRKLLVWQVYRNIEDETNDLAQSVYDGIKGHDPDLEESIEDWKKCLAWLEKQEERGPLTKEEEYILHRIIEYLEDETCPSEWISLLHDIYCLPYEKQKEQKPAYEQFPPLEGLDAIKAKYYDDGFKNGFDEGVESVKPAEWSERYIADVFENVGLAKIVREQGNDEITNAVQSAMIELSKGNKQEWSEEDERMRNQLIYDIEHHKKEGLISAKQNKATKALYDGIEKCYDEKIAWLKSLRPQPHYKPSEEQEEPEYYQHFDPDC